MGGTISGGKKAAKTNKERYTEEFYNIVGAKGGSTPTDKPKGMAAQTPEFRRAAGSLGGKASKRSRASLKGYDDLVKELGLEEEDE